MTPDEWDREGEAVCDEDEEEWIGHSSKRRRTDRSVILTFDKSQWLDQVAAVADRTVTSSRAALQLAATAVTSATEGNAKDRSFSRATLTRRRKIIRGSIAKKIKNEVKKELEQEHRFIIHWDERMMRGRRLVDGNTEYMAIVLTNLMTGSPIGFKSHRFYIINQGYGISRP